MDAVQVSVWVVNSFEAPGKPGSKDESLLVRVLTVQDVVLAVEDGISEDPFPTVNRDNPGPVEDAPVRNRGIVDSF